MKSQKILPSGAMKPNFFGVKFECGCGEQHPANETPHVACGSLNEFFHQCSNSFITLVKYKGIFKVHAIERWSCPGQIFQNFSEGKQSFSDREKENIMSALSNIVASIAGVDPETAALYAQDFYEPYIESAAAGDDTEWIIVWNAIRQVFKISGIEDAPAKALAIKALHSTTCTTSDEITIKICEYAIDKLSGDSKYLVGKALMALKNE